MGKKPTIKTTKQKPKQRLRHTVGLSIERSLYAPCYNKTVLTGQLLGGFSFHKTQSQWSKIAQLGLELVGMEDGVMGSGKPGGLQKSLVPESHIPIRAVLSVKQEAVTGGDLPHQRDPPCSW